MLNHRSRAFPALALALSFGACASSEHANFAAIHRDTGVLMSMDSIPEDAEPIAMVQADDSGFYLLGLIPFRCVSIDGCARRLAAEAQQLGADGIGCVEVIYDPASPVTLGGEFLIWFPWVGSVQMFGQAYKHR